MWLRFLGLHVFFHIIWNRRLLDEGGLLDAGHGSALELRQQRTRKYSQDALTVALQTQQTGALCVTYGFKKAVKAVTMFIECR